MFPLLGPRIPAETLERLWTMLAHEQAALHNASRLAPSLMISAQTVTRYIDLLVDLLLVRRLQPFHINVGKRLVRSPKVFVRDSGIVHALLGIAGFDALAGHLVFGCKLGRLHHRNLITAAPSRTVPSFYRTMAGGEIDLVLEIPGHGLWAFDIKAQPVGQPRKGLPSRRAGPETGPPIPGQFRQRPLPDFLIARRDRIDRNGRSSRRAMTVGLPELAKWRLRAKLPALRTNIMNLPPPA